MRGTAPYVNAGMPTFNAEYPENWPGSIDRARTCSASVAAKVSTIITVVISTGLRPTDTAETIPLDHLISC